MKKSYLVILLLLLSFKINAQNLNKEQEKLVQKFIQYFEKEDIDGLKKIVRYPLRRKKTIPSIKSEREFVKRFKQVFDNSLIHDIVNSDIQKDWDKVGSDGIMFNNGALWLDLNGNLISVNYKSLKEVEMIKEINKKSAKGVYKSLKEFKKHILVLETKELRIRIDQMPNGKYRYASWPIHSKMTDKPSVVLENGSKNFDGSGGNHYYLFYDNDTYWTYECSINVLRSNETAPATVGIFEGDSQVSMDDAKILE
ncbi:hypothetical protein [Aureivirga marina]|uniref:hypothetical protein n=1 Tax=Aureivirga marina TaxID=1182451 RepID=UPI0018C95C0C|nr:hypothetical protein [Aureivirga marina]